VTRLRTVEHRFVEFVPKVLEAGVVYVSMEYTTVAHLCCCGCGKRLVLPLSPAQWGITFDGESISLWPSVGSWDLDCRSHYVIEKNQVGWCKQWSQEQVSTGRRRDEAALDDEFKRKQNASALGGPDTSGRTRAWLTRTAKRLSTRN